MTHRFTLTVPLRENDGSSLADLHDGLERRLSREFGGLTMLAGHGVWSAPDARHPGRELVRVYVVDTDRADALDLFTRLARTIRRAAAQDAVYLTRQPIETWLVV